MTPDKLVSFRVARVRGLPRLAWAEGLDFSLPEEIMVRSRLFRQLNSNGRLDLRPGFAPPHPAAIGRLRLRAAYTLHKPLSGRLPFSYQRIPPGVRSIVAALLARGRGRRLRARDSFPAWPLDLSADFLADLIGRGPRRPSDAPTPVVLTHDIDSAEGLNNLVRLFIGLEEQYGARSTNFVVPLGWPLDRGLLSDIISRGHEIGAHGYDHSNRTPFADRPTRRRRLAQAADRLASYRAAGYRAPSLLRTRRLHEDLGDFFRYDASIPTSGGIFPVPDNGCASSRLFISGSVVELPLTLPRDGSLRFSGHSPGEILDIWIRCADTIARSGGVVVLLTHCERRFSGNRRMLAAYRRFVAYIAASKRYVWQTAAEVCNRWHAKTRGADVGRRIAP